MPHTSLKATDVMKTIQQLLLKAATPYMLGISGKPHHYKMLRIDKHLPAESFPVDPFAMISA
jgi:hypothetical protein